MSKQLVDTGGRDSHAVFVIRITPVFFDSFSYVVTVNYQNLVFKSGDNINRSVFAFEVEKGCFEVHGDPCKDNGCQGGRLNTDAKYIYLRTMSLFVSSLNSGSNGNCYYIGNEEEAVLIDAGISSRETERRLKRQELSIRKVKAIFITHEHADHIGGLRKLAKRHNLPVYITNETRRETRLEWRDIQVRNFAPHEEMVVGKLKVTAFPILHDANDPHGFIVSHEDVTVGVFTDLGTTNPVLQTYFQRCHAAFLEANYDEGMLESGTYPPRLKDRIRGDYGHLSNLQALQFFMTSRPPFMSHLFLSHLSQNNNSPEIVQQLFTEVAGTTEIVIATRHNETGVFHIGHNGKQRSPQPTAAAQLSLF